MNGIRVVIGTECIDSSKFNYMYHAITTTTTPCCIEIFVTSK